MRRMSDRLIMPVQGEARRPPFKEKARPCEFRSEHTGTRQTGRAVPPRLDVVDPRSAPLSKKLVPTDCRDELKTRGTTLLGRRDVPLGLFSRRVISGNVLRRRAPFHSGSSGLAPFTAYTDTLSAMECLSGRTENARRRSDSSPLCTIHITAIIADFRPLSSPKPRAHLPRFPVAA